MKAGSTGIYPETLLVGLVWDTDLARQFTVDWDGIRQFFVCVPFTYGAGNKQYEKCV